MYVVKNCEADSIMADSQCRSASRWSVVYSHYSGLTSVPHVLWSVRLGAIPVSRVHPQGVRATMSGAHRPIRSWSVQTLMVGAILLALAGCMTNPTHSDEGYELSSLRVVFLDPPHMQGQVAGDHRSIGSNDDATPCTGNIAGRRSRTRVL
jgi:hypothetical protein